MAKSRKYYSSFIGVQPKFGDRITFDHATPNEKNKIWEPDFIYNKELKLIESVLNDNDNNKENKISIEDIRRLYGKAYFLTSSSSSDLNLNLKEEAEKLQKNVYRDICPTNRAITVWKIMFWMSVLGEVAILTIQSIFSGGFNPFILLYAFLLATGGWLVGDYLGYYFFLDFLRKHQENKLENESNKKITVTLIFGIVLILFVAIVRAIFSYDWDTEGSFLSFGRIYVFVFTVILGVLVAIMEGGLSYSEELREFALTRQERALQIYSSFKIEEDLDNMIEKERRIKNEKEV